DWIELDIQLSSDGEAIVFHDDELDRLTQATGPVAARTASELVTMVISDLGGSGVAGEAIPTLAQVLEHSGDRCPLYIELKSDGRGMESERNRRLLDRCVALIGVKSAHVVASFDVEIVRAALGRGLRAVLIFSEMEVAHRLSKEEQSALHAFSARGDLLETGALELARSRQRALWLWTLDDEASIRHALECGVDAICSNDVSLARSIVDSWPN
ncbi:MAG TPA: glycerophosphodiester phosphodiesterase, partial [Candidatus Krumholzibacteria bacterium]